jgi:PleD family two-component response regulator
MTADPIPLSDAVPTRVLLIGDHKDYQRVCDLLDAARHVTFTVDWAQSVEDATAHLGMDACDIWVVDHDLPDGRGLDVVRAAHDRGLRAPIVMLTGCGRLDLDLETMGLGASDFLDKDRLDVTLLERTIRYALARHRQAERLNRLAQYDELTGLANRSLFQDRLERALAWARRHSRLAAVMILDRTASRRSTTGSGTARAIACSRSWRSG